MKKVFLLFGMAACCSASAQQKDVFDINRHIRNLQDKKKSIQEIKNPLSAIKNFDIGLVQPDVKLSHVLSNGNIVYKLPVDNMPCIVPGDNNNILPNVSDPGQYYVSPYFKNDTPGSMPNAIKPYRIIPAK